MRYAWLCCVFLSLESQAAGNVFAPMVKGCLVLFPALMPVTDPDNIHNRFPVKPIVLQADLWAGAKPGDFASRYLPPEFPRSDGYQPKFFSPRDLEERARQLAADYMDERSVTYVSPLPDGTQIKMHMGTGELLVTNGKGQLACFVKLPVGQRSIAGDATTAMLFSRLTGIITTPQKYGQVPKRFAQLSAGESVPFNGFPGDSHLVSHVDKHTLGILNASPHLTPADRARMARTTAGGYKAEFIDLQTFFLRDMEAAKGDAAKGAKAYAELKAAYSARAEKFMTSTKPSILTMTRAEKRTVNGKEQMQILGFRFDTLTNELAIFDRETGRVITYFRVEMDPANKWLEKTGYPTVNSPMEYFLSVAKISHRE